MNWLNLNADTAHFNDNNFFLKFYFSCHICFKYANNVHSLPCDGSSQNPRIVQSRSWGRLTPWDRHLNNGRRSKISSITPSISGPLRNIYSPLLPLKEQLTISPSPRCYKEGMNIAFNVPTDKREERLQVYINGSPGRKKGKKNTQTHKHTDTLTPTKHSFSWVTHSNFGIGGSVAGTTPVQDSSFFYYSQDRDTGGRFHSGRSYSMTIWTSSPCKHFPLVC